MLLTLGHLDVPADLDSGSEDADLVQSAEITDPLVLGAVGYVRLLVQVDASQSMPHGEPKR